MPSYMLLRFQKAAVRGNYETGNQAFSMRLRFLTIRLGQLDDCTFRCAVRGDQPRSEEGVHTANIDNLSSLMTHHRLGGKLREKEDCIELGLDYIVPILRLLVQNTAAQRH